jgi:hypothetical protein
MEKKGRVRRKDSSPDLGKGGAQVRTPAKGDSSSSNLSPPSDSPTPIDIPISSSPDSPTITCLWAGQTYQATAQHTLGSHWLLWDCGTATMRKRGTGAGRERRA